MLRPPIHQQATTDEKRRSRAPSGDSGKVIASLILSFEWQSLISSPFHPSHLRREAPQSAPRAVFGVPLEESLEVSQICNLPSIVFRSIQYLEAKKADQEEGIYRLSGSSAVIKALKDRFNNGS
jgi:hypothetical protein